MAHESFGYLFVHAGFFGSYAQANQAPSAHQRLGRELALQSSAVGIEISVGQQGDVEGIVRAVYGLGGERIGAVANDAGVASIEQDGADSRLRLGQEAVDVGTAAEDHASARVRTSWRWCSRTRRRA